MAICSSVALSESRPGRHSAGVRHSGNVCVQAMQFGAQIVTAGLRSTGVGTDRITYFLVHVAVTTLSQLTVCSL